MTGAATATELPAGPEAGRLGRNYFKLFSASTVSNLGDDIGVVAYP